MTPPPSWKCWQRFGLLMLSFVPTSRWPISSEREMMMMMAAEGGCPWLSSKNRCHYDVDPAEDKLMTSLVGIRLLPVLEFYL